jgi:hypothetical protein
LNIAAIVSRRTSGASLNVASTMTPERAEAPTWSLCMS